jgi:hypothetical protein
MTFFVMGGGRGMLPMRPSFAWLVFAALTIAGLVELLRSHPILPPFVVGMSLLAIGVLAGLRWGADAATRLINDLTRTNAYLAEQNDELSELNYELLSRINENATEEAKQE